MDFDPPSSPPYVHFDGSILHQASPPRNNMSPNQRSTNHTPKRRRIVPPQNQIASQHVEGPFYEIPQDIYNDWAAESIDDFRRRQPYQLPTFSSAIGDLSEQFFLEPPDHFWHQQPPILQTQPRQPRVQHPPVQQPLPNFNPRAYSTPRVPFGPVVSMADQRTQSVGDVVASIAQRSAQPSIRRVIPVHAPRPAHTSPPSQRVSKDAVHLTLSRATHESIDQIAEHKRECPACQLDFEPDNFVAVVSCCDTPMHVTCFSAWINSNNGPGNTRTRCCMKCRKPVDARRQLNNIIPSVDGKAWDENQDFGVPPSLVLDNPITIDITALSESRRRREAQQHYNRPFRFAIPVTEIPEDMQAEYQRLLHTQRSEDQRMKAYCRESAEDWGSTFDLHARAADALADAKELIDAGGRISQQELEGLEERNRILRQEEQMVRAERRQAEDAFRGMEQRHLLGQREFIGRIQRRRLSMMEAEVRPSDERTISSAT